MSMALVGEGEVQLMRRTLREMGYNAARQLPTFPVDHNYMPALRQRLMLSKKIDEVMRKNKKQNAEHQWLQQAAKDLEVDLDDDYHADVS
jgi:nucleoside 2-deoxyribosyltransferase